MPYKNQEDKRKWQQRDKAKHPERYKQWGRDYYARTQKSLEVVKAREITEKKRADKAASTALAKERREYPSLLRAVMWKERTRAEARQREKLCIQCGKIKPFADMVMDKRSANGIRSCCKQCANGEAKLWRENNLGSKLASRRKRYEKIKKDPSLLISKRIRDRMGKVIKRHGAGLNVSGSKMQYLGCTGQQVKAHLEAQFTDKMTWGNYGSYWHVDHIRPLASYDMNVMADRMHAFHYSNLQPLEAMENVRKSDNWTPDVSQVSMILGDSGQCDRMAQLPVLPEIADSATPIRGGMSCVA